MPAWATFAGLTAVLVVLILVLTRTSQQLLQETVVVDADGEPKIDGAADPPWPDADGTGSASSENDVRTEPAGARDERLDRKKRQEHQERQDTQARQGSQDSLKNKESESAIPPESTTDEPPIETVGEEPADIEAVEEEPTSTETVTGDTPSAHVRPRITTLALLGNVVVSQGLFLGLLVAVAWWTNVPASAFGLAADVLTTTHVALGIGAGVAIYGANEVGAGASERFGFSAPERLRTAMAPTTPSEWVFLLVVVLPVIAVFEELLFRGALIGAMHAGFGIDPWLLAVVSSAIFGLGHGAQGRLGIAVTALLGLVLAAIFILTGSLLVVIVAHYVVNAMEFLIREGIGWEPLGA